MFIVGMAFCCSHMKGVDIMASFILGMIDVLLKIFVIFAIFLIVYYSIYHLAVLITALVKGCNFKEAKIILRKEFKEPYPSFFRGNIPYWTKIDKFNIAVIGSLEAYKRLIAQEDEENPFYYAYEINISPPYLYMTFPVKDRDACNSLRNKYITATRNFLRNRGCSTITVDIVGYNSFFDRPSICIYFSRDSDEKEKLLAMRENKKQAYLDEKLYTHKGNTPA